MEKLIDDSTLQQDKNIIWQYWQDFNARQSPIEDLVNGVVNSNINWNGPHPFNELQGTSALIEGFWRPLVRSFPDIKKKPYILLADHFTDGVWVSATGNFIGTFEESWLGIPATGKEVSIRFGEFCRMEDGKIVEVYILLDIIDVMRQAGFHVLPPSKGLEGIIPGPQSRDGVWRSGQDETVTARNLKLVDDMLAGLGRFDGNDLQSMDMLDYWKPEMHWYGPCGIGTSIDMSTYEQNHAGPFLHAFPDRRGGHHKAHLGEGNYVATTGWPSVMATHTGEYLGCPATGRSITMRVMDWWRIEDDYLVENWVLIDMINLFLQFGIDLFVKLRQQTK